MATIENMPQPSDVLDVSSQAPLVSHTFPQASSLVAAGSHFPATMLARSGAKSAKEKRDVDNHCENSSRHSAPAVGRVSPVKGSVESSVSGSLSPSSVSPQAPQSDDLESPMAVSRNSDDESPFPEETINRLSQYSLTPEPITPSLPRNKIQFIISLKGELKKHNTIPANFNKLGFFEELYKLLADDMWEIRNETTLLILDLLPYLKSDVDSCMAIVLPNLIPNLGDSRARLQKSNVKLLKAYASVSKDKEGLVEDLVTYGINHKKKNVSKMATLNIIHLLTKDLYEVDLSLLAQSLYTKLQDSDMKPAALPTFRQLRSLVGEEKFNSYINYLSSRSREMLDELLECVSPSAKEVKSEAENDDHKNDGGNDQHTGDNDQQNDGTDDQQNTSNNQQNDGIDDQQNDGDDEQQNVVDHKESESGDKNNEIENGKLENNEHKRDDDINGDNDDHEYSNDVVLPTLEERRHSPDGKIGSSQGRTEFGIIDAAIIDKIRHPRDWKTRSEGCEQLWTQLKCLEDFTAFLPHLSNFLSLLDSLIDDNNFRISIIVLDIFRILIEKLQGDLPTYLRQIVHSVIKQVGDSKVVVRIENMKVFQKLLQNATPAAVMPILCDNLGHRSPRVREDCLNFIIYALMTFPSYEFDLNYLSEKVSMSVTDPKRRVRLAALECMAAIAQFLGPAKLGPLMAALDNLEDKDKEAGALAAVQARLARRQLPRVTPDGLIEYSLVVPSSNKRNNLTYPKGADVDWVLAGSGGIMSALSGGNGNLSSSLSSSFAASDSFVNTLAYAHPQSSPTLPRSALHEESLHRKRSFSDVALNTVDERGLTLWNTDTIDLSRTAPPDLGYSLLPNKYGSSGVGSARGDTPTSRSPSIHRRLNSLAPLDQGSARSFIPPLSAVSRRSRPGHTHEFHSDPEDDFDEEDKSEEYYYEEDEVEEEEVEEDLLAEDKSSSRPRSSATTLDSGISVFSVSNEFDAATENVKEEVKGAVNSASSSGNSSSGRQQQQIIQSKGSSASSLSSVDDQGRSSYDLGVGRNHRVGTLPSPSSHSLPSDALRSTGFAVVSKGVDRGAATRSRITPGSEKEFHNFNYESDFEADEEDPNNITLANTTLTKMKLLRKKQEHLKEIERRRQERDNRRTQEERARKYRQLEIQHSQSSLQPSRADSGDSSLAVRTTLNYTGQTTRASPQPSPLHGVKPNPHLSPRPSSRPSPVPNPPSRINLPKSKSHHGNLSKNLSRGIGNAERRNRSLERHTTSQTSGVHTRETFRTPQIVKRGQPPNGSGGRFGSDNQSSNLVNNGITTSLVRRNPRRFPDRSSDDLPAAAAISVGMRTSKPASSCFKKHLEPFANPNDALKNAHQLLNSADWENQVEGIEMMVRLTEHHPEVLHSDLHSVNLALLKQAKNLRSQVSRAAIQAFTRLFDTLKRNMESDSEKIVAMLLHRTADTNKFLQLDSHHALDALVENISPTKSIPAIIQEGISHKNAVVRTTVARLLAYEVERLGPSRVLSGQKDITDRILPAAAKLAQDGSLETRQYIKQIFQQLIHQGQFETALKKYVTATEIKNIQKFLDNLKNEGRTIKDSARSKFGTGARYTRTM
ncbi:TOG array regulator of axonemal microtubules protein 1 isoform X3 [Cherax quadricarinatus]